MRILCAALISMMAVSAHAADVPKFIDETKTSGIKSIYDGDFAYMAGAGVAVFDCSGDGLPELAFAGGENPSQLYLNRASKGTSLKFKKAVSSGVELDKVTGFYPLDIDGDGHVDLVTLRVGENVLLRGLGACRFERANEAWGFDGGNTWTTAFSATWEKGNKWPTLAIGNFMIPETVIMNYGDCDANELHRPTPRGGYGAPTKLRPGHCTLSMLFSDWNRDGVPDLRISNDKEFYTRGEEQLVRLGRDGPQFYGRKDGWQPVKIWGMGIASHDVTGDGYPDYYLTNMTDNRFEVLAGGTTRPRFTDKSTALGIAAGFPFIGGDKKPSTAWHAEFGDVNNDGLADLLVVKGNVEAIPALADVDPNNLLIQQTDGGFIEGAVKADVVDFELGRSGALADLNGDGHLDLIVTNRFKPARIWRNTGTDGKWIKVRLNNGTKNSAGIGAWVEVRTKAGVQRRELTVGGGHAGGQWGWLHFGLGKYSEAEVRVQYPNRAWSNWEVVKGNQTVTLTP